MHKKIKRTRENIGSISSGTMRPEDLIPAFIYELRQQTPTKREHARLANGIERAAMKKGYWESDICQTDLEMLFEALNEYSPSYFYFGAHTGDGSDYGFWLSESFNEDFDGLKISDLAELPAQYTGEFLVVSDHGNPSLYQRYSNGRIKLIWAIV